MIKKLSVWCMFAAFVTAGVTARAGAPPLQKVSPNDEWCRNEGSSNDDRQGYCEVREYTVAGGASVLVVDASPNGGIKVEGAPRGDVLVRAKVTSWAATEQRAREIASAVRIDATPARVAAEGPTGLDRRESWSVSYQLTVPNQSSLSLQTVNGGITIQDVEGRIDFKTVNGGVKLAGLAGEVRGRTSNGGVDVELDGPSWRGEGLDVETSNGGVKLGIPESYSAHLEVGTVNGGLSADIPVPTSGEIDRRDRRPRDLNMDLGGGGPLIRVRTHNGGVKISKK